MTYSKNKKEWYEDTKSRFINPYTFIDLEENCNKNQNSINISKSKDVLSGYISCTLIPKSPLFIPNTTNDNYFEENVGKHKSYDFYSYDDLSSVTNNKEYYHEPVIPGSSIRGVIRSDFEAVTNSCMSTTNDNKRLYKRLPDAGKPGLLIREKGEINLYSAERVMVKYKECNADTNEIIDTKNIAEGQKVWIKKGVRYKNLSYMPFTASDLKTKPMRGFIEGYFLKGEYFPRKHHASVMLKKSPTAIAKICDANNIDICEELICIKEILELYGNEKINKNVKKGHTKYEGDEGYKTAYDNFMNGEQDVLPVYYKEFNGFYYMSPACITKEVYKNKIKDLLRGKNYCACSDINNLCEACSLFGMVGMEEKKDKMLNTNPSRIRFTDAIILNYDKNNEQKYFYSPVVLDELSLPKVSATEFYLKRFEDADIWTYDFAFKWNRNNREILDGYKPEIRGRKFYWNHKDDSVFNDIIKKNNEMKDENVTIRSLKHGKDIKFLFRVYFDRVTEDELKKIICILNVGKNKDEKTGMHKLGMGKPLGMGSIKITVDSVKIRNIKCKDDKISYSLDEYESNKNYEYNFSDIFGNNNSVKEYLKISNLIDSNYPIVYPLGENPDGGLRNTTELYHL